MFLLTAYHLTGAEVIHVEGGKQWLLVAGPKRCELLQFTVQFAGDIPEVDDGIYIQDGLRLLGLYVLVDIPLEAAAELGDVVPAQRQACRIGVAAEVDQHVAATLDGRIDVEAGDAAGRAGGKLTVASQHNRRPEIDFCESRGHDADDAFLPVLIVEHDARLVFLAFQLGHNLVGLLGHLLVNVFALLVVLVDVLGFLQGQIVVFLNQQVDALFAVLHASAGIDARSDFEYDIAHRDVASAQSADVDDGLDADVRVLVELLQAVERQYAVFILHGHDVGCYAHSTEVEQGDEPREGNAIVLGKGLHELKSHAASAEMLEGVGVVFALRVENGGSRRHHLVGDVVVANDEVDAKTLGIGYFVDCLDTAIENDNEFHTGFLGKVYSFLAHAISLVIAVGDIVVDVRIELLEKLVYQCYSCAPVDIVVAIDHNAFFAPHCVVQTVNSHVHIFHQKRIDEVVELGTEESLGCRFSSDAAAYEQSAQYGTDCQLGRQLFSCFLLV